MLIVLTILLAGAVALAGFKVLMYTEPTFAGIQIAVVGIGMICTGLWFMEFSLSIGIKRLKNVYN